MTVGYYEITLDLLIVPYGIETTEAAVGGRTTTDF